MSVQLNVTIPSRGEHSQKHIVKIRLESHLVDQRSQTASFLVAAVRRRTTRLQLRLHHGRAWIVYIIRATVPPLSRV